MSERVIESEKTGFFKIAALIRGPPQAEAAGAVEAEEGAREGKAISDRVSNWTVEDLALGLVMTSPRGGNGSGAPSSWCLFCKGDVQ